MNDLPTHSAMIVDGHPLTRNALSRLVADEANLSVVAEKSDYYEALDALITEAPDLVIMELRLDGGCGLQLIKEIRQISSEIKILVFTSFDGSVYAERALKAGANGFISKREEIVKSIRAVHRILDGEMVLSTEINQQILSQFAQNNDGCGSYVLTDRELRVLELIGTGFTTREIAEHLQVSTKTIESHRERIKAKLNISCGARLSRHAVEWVLTRS